MRILVVEEEVKMAGLLKRGLEEEGYAVDVAPDGQEALWMATEDPWTTARAVSSMTTKARGWQVGMGQAG